MTRVRRRRALTEHRPDVSEAERADMDLHLRFGARARLEASPDASRRLYREAIAHDEVCPFRWRPPVEP